MTQRIKVTYKVEINCYYKKEQTEEIFGSPQTGCSMQTLAALIPAQEKQNIIDENLSFDDMYRTVPDSEKKVSVEAVVLED